MDWSTIKHERMLHDIAAVGRQAIEWLVIEQEEDPHAYQGMHFLVDSLLEELNVGYDLDEWPSWVDIDKAINRNPDGDTPAEHGAIGTLVLATVLGHEDTYREHLRDRAFDLGVTGDLLNPATQAAVLQANAIALN